MKESNPNLVYVLDRKSPLLHVKRGGERELKGRDSGNG
jgi:hypothetical protein